MITWVNNNKVGDEPNVLLGQSMGGVVGRYTLAKMEQENAPDHDVRLFISHDAPLQGANTPIAIQHLSRHMHNEYVQQPILQILGEFALPVLTGLAEIFEDAANVFFNNAGDFIAPYVSS